MKSKTIYKKGQVFSYVFGDLKAKFLTIFGEFFNNDLGVYFANRFKDKRDKDIINQAAAQSLSNTNDKELLLDLINVLQADSASESKAILEKGLNTFQKLQSQNAKAAEEAQQAQRDHDMAVEEKIDQRGREKNQNNIDVANIYADNKTFNENEKNTSNELMALAKIVAEQLKAKKESMKPQSKSEKKE